MSIKQIVDKLRKEISGRNREDFIDDLEEMLSENAKELSINEYFFHLPLKHIFSVISRVNFISIDEDDGGFDVLHNFIKNTIHAHFEEKETLLILQNIDIEQILLSYEKTFAILELFTNCPILNHFCRLHKDKQQLPEKDYEYELNQKDSEIEKLKQQNKELQSKQNSKSTSNFVPILEKPKDLESDIFKACREGKLTSVQWLIEKCHIDKNKRVVTVDFKLGFFQDDTPIHIASLRGHLPIVEYLIEKQNVSPYIKGSIGQTPLHDACSKGHLPIVQYLIEKKNVNPNVQKNYEKTSLHDACEKGHLHIVEYLISKGSKIEAKETYYGRTPLHNASYWGHTKVVKYLVSKGANKQARDKDGKTPYDLARNDEIKEILK